MKTSTLLAILCSLLIILGSLGWPVLRITLNRSRGEIEAQQSFRLLQEKALTILDTADAIQNSTWRANARLSMENDRRLLSLLVKQADGTLLFALPASSPFYYLPDEALSQGNMFNAPEFSTIRSSAILTNGLQLDALYMTFSQEELFRILMETLLGLLVISLSAASVLLFSPRIKPKTLAGNTMVAEAASPAAAVASEPDSAGVAAMQKTAGKATSAEAAIPAEPPAVSPPPAIPEATLKTKTAVSPELPLSSATEETSAIVEPTDSTERYNDTEDYYEEIEDFEDTSELPEIEISNLSEDSTLSEDVTDQVPLSEEAEDYAAADAALSDDGLAIVEPDPERLADQMERDLRQAQISMAGIPDSESIPRKKIPVQEGEIGGPQGLYDPDTGLCWESYLRERLGAELRRAASFEQDLVLLVASWDTVSKDSEDYLLFATTLRDFFNFPDLSFGFGPDGVAVVLPNVDIDHAMRQTEELIKKLTFIIQNQAEELRYLEIFMGLSSRSGRIVDADRLIAETLVALKKARGERDTHVMAFRPDPERFRSYLTNR